jgi:hypothetical protein
MWRVFTGRNNNHHCSPRANELHNIISGSITQLSSFVGVKVSNEVYTVMGLKSFGSV